MSCQTESYLNVGQVGLDADLCWQRGAVSFGMHLRNFIFCCDHDALSSLLLQVISGIWSSSSGSSLGFDCILPRHTAIPLAMGKVLLSLFTPVAIICIVLASKAVMHHLKARSTRGRTSHTGHQFASLVMSVVLLFLPTWVGTTFSLLTCIQLDRPASWPFQAAAVGTWWVEDMSQQCYSPSGYHKQWAHGLGIPLVVCCAWCCLWACNCFCGTAPSRASSLIVPLNAMVLCITCGVQKYAGMRLSSCCRPLGW